MREASLLRIIKMKDLSGRNLTTAASLCRLKLKHSKGPMTAHQESLPRQPLPPLQESLKKYLKSVHPLLTQHEYERTEKIVKDFGCKGGVAEQLYSKLKDDYRQLDNWIVDRWLKEEYLKNRTPLSPYVTPAAVISCMKFQNEDDRLKFSAKLICASLEYRRMVDEHLLEPDMLGGQPLDMSQHFMMLSTCRVPGKGCDRLVHYYNDEFPSRHIIVAKNNRFFKVDVIDKDGNPLSEIEIFKQLQSVVTQSAEEGPSVGLLTSLHRDLWAQEYEIMNQDDTNRNSIEMIEKSMFILSLDKAVPESVAPDIRSRGLHNCLHGCGPHFNAANRWVDKTVTLIVSEDGVFGVKLETTPIEAQPLQRMVDHALRKMLHSDNVVDLSSRLLPEPTELCFNLTPQTEKAIQMAKETSAKTSKDVDITSLSFRNFGSNFLKEQRVSTDSFIQMAFQLAFYRLHGIRGVVCGVATLHKFYRGQYDLIHSTSDQAIDFCKGMMSESTSLEEKRMKLKNAILFHKASTVEALKGEGIDYLLTGLKLAADESGIQTPEIYLDPAYESYSNIRLISSQVSGSLDQPIHISYGPFTLDGYGSPYSVYPNKLHFCFFSLKHRPESSSTALMECLKRSLLDMETVLRTDGKNQ